MILSALPSSAPVHYKNGTSWKMMTAVDLRNYTDFEYEEAPPASFARRRVTVSLTTDNDVYGSYHQKRFLGFGMVFDLPPLPFRDFRDVPAGTQTSPEEEFNIFVASTDNSSTKQQSLFLKRDTTETSSRGKILVQESSQELHENDFVDGDDDFEPLPVSRLVSDYDEFCDFIRMNIHDPFDN
eukprot:scaffold2954_cov195-Alexandrium_tamarense.AAC.22